MFTSKIFDSTFLPASFAGPKHSTKIMILMHGIGDHKASYKDFALELNLTGLDYLLINAPTPYFFGFSWYDLAPADPIIGIKSSVSKIRELIKELNDHGYKNEDILIGGFSQGGCIALHSFLEMESIFGGIVCMSPRIYLEGMSVQIKEHHLKTPVFMAHGNMDQAINFKEVEKQYQELKAQGLIIEWHEHDMGHEIVIEEIVQLRNWLNRQI
jgi:predicted esterase